jgi:integrase
MANPIRVRPFNKLNKQALVVEKNYWKRFYSGFLNYLYQQGLYDNYAGMLIKVLRAVFRYIEDEKMISVGKFYKSFYIPKEDILITTLSPERLNYLIVDSDFEERLSQDQCLIRDIFVFGCSVGLRFYDLIKIRPMDIVQTGGKCYLGVKAQKTGALMNVRLPVYAMAIVNKYKKRGQKTIFPSMSLAWFNKCLKRLCEGAGWTEPVDRTRNRRGVSKNMLVFESQKAFRFCDCVSSHMMRRTAITTMLMNGVPELVVKKISGHTDDSKSFYRYVNLVQSYMDDAVEAHFEKLVALNVSTATRMSLALHTEIG